MSEQQVGGAGVPVAAGETPVILAGGGTAWVKRLRKTQITDLTSRIPAGAGDTFTAMMLAELLVRSAVIRTDSLDDGQGGRLEVKRRREGVLELAQRDLYDALQEEDVVAILKVARGQLPEHTTGK